MATFKEIELNKVNNRLDDAVKELMEWEKEQEKKLYDLEDGLMEGKWSGEEKTRREEQRNRLVEEKKKLEKDKDDWKNQVINLQNKLTDFGKEKGNEQIVQKKIYKKLFSIHSHFVYLFICLIYCLQL